MRQIYTVGRLVAETAVRDRLIAQNPFQAVKRPKVTKTEAVFLTADEEVSLLASAAGSRYALLFDFMLNTGLRRGEALALRWLDVNVEDEPKEKPKIPPKRLRVVHTLGRQEGDLVVTEPKTQRSKRTVPLNEDALRVLRQVKKRTAADKLRAGNKWHDTGFVFVTEFGEPCDPRNALRTLTVAASKAEIKDVGLHTLRHTFATRSLNAGVPIAVVSRLLGHSSIQGDRRHLRPRG